MIKFKGKGVYGAIAIGRVRLLKKSRKKPKKFKIPSPSNEILRLSEAKLEASRELDAIYARAKSELGEANAQIFQIHKMMLDDEDYNDSITSIIRTQSVNAEYAVSVACENFSYLFSSMSDPYMRARAADIEDVSSRLISILQGESVPVDASTGHIICSDDLTPSETISLDTAQVLAFVTSGGSLTSHSAILARNMAIPAVVSVGERFLSCLSDGDMLCVDGYTGEVVINPDAKTLESFVQRQSADIESKERLTLLRGKDTVTLDGTKIKLFANVGSIAGVGEALLSDAEGIGLFRSEFLYLERDSAPSEDEQFSIYKRILETMGERLTVIRTLDIGADKVVPYLDLPKEENPALGLRGIRLCLQRAELFKEQLRALLRASAHGHLGIMFPMITSKSELERALDLLNDAKSELISEQIPISNDIQIGIMIETPASALISDELATLVDFFSVGTNDLTQYTLACDRQSPFLDEFCDTHHDSIFKLIEMSARSIHAHGGWIGICGELASDLSLTEDFLRMGIDELSVSPVYILRLREIVRGLDLSK